MSNILPHSALAACNVFSRARVYYQGVADNAIHESTTDDGVTYVHSPNPLPTPGSIMTFTPLSVVCHDGNDVDERRIYYLNAAHELQELRYNGGKWITGELNNFKFVAASYSKLAALHFEDQFHVFYQNDRNEITLVSTKGATPWQQVATLHSALPGTSLSAIRTSDRVIRIYYQAHDFTIRQQTSKDGWNDDNKVDTPLIVAHTALVAVPIYTNHVNIRLYAHTLSGNRLVQMSGDASDVWKYSDPPVEDAAMPLTQLAAVTWGHAVGSCDAIHIFSQKTGNDLEVRKWQKGQGLRMENVPTA